MSLYTERDDAGERSYSPSELASELALDEMLTLAGFTVLHVAEELGERYEQGAQADDEMDQRVARLNEVVDTLGEEAQALHDERIFNDEDDLDLAAVCEGEDDDDGNTLWVVDCQACGIIVDTVHEADDPDARARADDIARDHNATHHVGANVMHASNSQGGRNYVVSCPTHGLIEMVHYPTHPFASIRASDLAREHDATYHREEHA